MIEHFDIIKPTEIVESLKKYRDTYNERGKYLGFKGLNDLYTMQLGTCTDWTGFPRSGKTQVLMELLLNTSLYYGWKHLVYFPDVGNTTEIIADLLHKKTHKGFNNNYPNVIDDKTIYRETEWLLDHFKILYKKNVKGKMTPFEFWDLAVEIKKESQLHTASIDAWKDMSHPYNQYGGYAMYLEVCLPYRNQIAEDHNLHLHTVIHPKLTEKENGVRKSPTPYDIKGGSEWINSGKCMVTVHRESTDTNVAEISVHKIKPRSAGNVGVTSLMFDVGKLVYYSMIQTLNGVEKEYAKPAGKNIKTNRSNEDDSKQLVKQPPKNQQLIKPNLEFNNVNNRIESKTTIQNDDWLDGLLDEETFE